MLIEAVASLQGLIGPTEDRTHWINETDQFPDGLLIDTMPVEGFQSANDPDERNGSYDLAPEGHRRYRITVKVDEEP